VPRARPRAGTATDDPDVEELHRRAQQVDDSISLATLYRTVRLFEQLGIVECHAFNGRGRHQKGTETEFSRLK